MEHHPVQTASCHGTEEDASDDAPAQVHSDGRYVPRNSKGEWITDKNAVLLGIALVVGGCALTGVAVVVVVANQFSLIGCAMAGGLVALGWPVLKIGIDMIREGST